VIGPQARSLVLVLDGLRSAENVGNLFRTAEVSARAKEEIVRRARGKKQRKPQN